MVKRYKHKVTGIVGVDQGDGHIHYERTGEREGCHETIWKGFVKKSNDWEKIIDKDELLKEAETKYPKGTRYYAANRVGWEDVGKDFTIGTSTGKFIYIDNGKIHITSEDNKSIYYNGKWAKVKKEPLFITKDGVDIYEGDKYWMSSEDFYIILMENADIEAGQAKYYKYFSTKEAAQKYIDTFKPKYNENDMKNFVIEAILYGMSLNESKEQYGKA